MNAVTLSRAEMGAACPGADYLSEREPLNPNSTAGRTDRVMTNFRGTLSSATSLAAGTLITAGGLSLAAIGTVITGASAIGTNSLAYNIFCVGMGVVGAAATAFGAAHTTAALVNESSPEEEKVKSLKDLLCSGLFVGPFVGLNGYNVAAVGVVAAGGTPVVALVAPAAAAVGGVAAVIGGAIIRNALNNAVKIESATSS